MASIRLFIKHNRLMKCSCFFKENKDISIKLWSWLSDVQRWVVHVPTQYNRAAPRSVPHMNDGIAEIEKRKGDPVAIHWESHKHAR